MKPRFTIRSLLVATTLAAGCAFMARTSDWVAALGVASTAFLLFGVAQLSKFSRVTWLNRLLRMGLASVAAAVGWFAFVDSSHWYEWCEHCEQHRFVDEVRLAGVPVWTKRGENHVNNLDRLKIDFGMPCEHEYGREHLVREWGLIYAARPCVCVLCCFGSDPDYYNAQVSESARRFAKHDPDGAQRLIDRIVKSEDYDAMHAFIAAMKQPGVEWTLDSLNLESGSQSPMEIR